MKRFSFFLAISVTAMVLAGCQFSKDPNKKEQVFIRPADTSIYDLAAGRDSAAFAEALKGLSDEQIELYGPDGRTLLFVAAKSGTIENVEALLARGALPLRPSKGTTETPLTIAIKSERTPVIAALEERVRQQEDSVRQLLKKNRFKEGLEKFQAFFLQSEPLKTQLVNQLIELLRFERFLREENQPLLRQALEQLTPESFDAIGALAVAEISNDTDFADLIRRRFPRQLKASAPAKTSAWLMTLHGERLLINMERIIAAEIPFEKAALTDALEKRGKELPLNEFSEMRFLLKTAAAASLSLDLDDQKLQRAAIKESLTKGGRGSREDLLLIRETIRKSSLCIDCVTMIVNSNQSRAEVGKHLEHLFDVFPEIPPTLVAAVAPRVSLADLEVLLSELGAERLRSQKGVLASAFARTASATELQLIYSTLMKFGLSITAENATETLEVVLTNRWTLKGGASELAAILIRDLTDAKGKIQVENAQRWLEKEILFLLMSRERRQIYLVKEIIALSDKPFDSVIRELPLTSGGKTPVKVSLAYLTDILAGEPQGFLSPNYDRVANDISSSSQDQTWALSARTKTGSKTYSMATVHALFLFSDISVLDDMEVSSLRPAMSVGVTPFVRALAKEDESWLQKDNLFRKIISAPENDQRNFGLRAIFNKLNLRLGEGNVHILEMLSGRIFGYLANGNENRLSVNFDLLTHAMTVFNPRLRFAMAREASLKSYLQIFALETSDPLCEGGAFNRNAYDWIATSEGKPFADESLRTQMNSHCSSLSKMTKDSFLSDRERMLPNTSYKAALKQRAALIEAKQMRLQIEWLNALKEIRAKSGNSPAAAEFFSRIPTTILSMPAELPPLPHEESEPGLGQAIGQDNNFPPQRPSLGGTR